MPAESRAETLSIHSLSGDYEVHIGSNILLPAMVERESFVVADSYFKNLLPSESAIFVDATEDRKNLATVEQVIVELKNRGLNRSGSITAVGGGVIQDIATLAASLFMRGVSWVYAPTTLMAMVDSCIGGKSSINAGSVKNLVGNIYPPTSVIIDTDFVRTLREVDKVSGFAEAVKISYCRGETSFMKFLELYNLHRDSDLASLLVEVLSAKKWFIEIDEFDQAERRLLNFGHTFGHAFEVGSKYSIPHGVAVAVGMLSALRFVEMDRRLMPVEHDLRNFLLSLVKPDWNSPEVDWRTLRAAFESDKKHSSGAYRLVLPEIGGGVALCDQPRNDETWEKVRTALANALLELES
jgi:3-dehydroquinate synthase